VRRSDNAAKWIAQAHAPLVGRVFSCVYSFDGERLAIAHATPAPRRKAAA
jgi:hypothetical protein